jgi:uncharacterized membrane protein
MKTRHFIRQLDRRSIEAAIRDAESRTSGEIRVLIYHKDTEDAVALAQREFIRHGLQKTAQRNAVLILVAPEAQKFAVIGDRAVHEKCGAAFWEKLAATMAGTFRAGDFTAGLRQGIALAGQLLAGHFPRRPGDANELPDRVIEE